MDNQNSDDNLPVDDIDAGLQENTDLASDEISHDPEEVETDVETEDSPDQPDQEDGTEETEVDNSKGKDEPKKSAIQKRIDKLVAKNYSQEEKYEKELAEIKARLEKYESPQVQETKLTKEDFATDEEYDDYRLDQRLIARESKQRDQQAQLKQANQQAKVNIDTFSAKVATVRDKLPDDFDEKISSAKNPLPDDLIKEIVASDHAPQLAYHFASYPQEIRNYENMTVAQKVIFFNEFKEHAESELQTKKPKTRAPKPAAKPIQSGRKEALNIKKIATMTHIPEYGDAYLKWHREQKNKKR